MKFKYMKMVHIDMIKYEDILDSSSMLRNFEGRTSPVHYRYKILTRMTAKRLKGRDEKGEK